MSDARSPNVRLRTLLREADWTGEALARAVAACGADSGLGGRVDRTSVSHWLAGRRPRWPVPGLVAEALSRRLGRPVTVAATGLVGGTESSDEGPSSDPDPPAELRALGAGRTSRRSLNEAYVYRLAELDEVRLPWPPRARAAADLTVGRDHVRSVEAVTRVFSDADQAFGGGHSRTALAGYLATTAAPMVEGRAPTRVRGPLLSAVARLTYLCGFMCVDDQLHGAAQRYYLLAARLADEAADTATRAIVLRGLSVQARSLGHHQQAFGLAEAAISLAGTADPLTRAFLHGQLAVCAGTSGDRRSSVHALRTAHALIDRAADEHRAVGAYHLAALAHQEAAALAGLGTARGALRALTAAVSDRPQGERRSRALVLAELAGAHLAANHLEQAVDVWHRFLDELPLLHSARVRAARSSLRNRLRPYQRNHAAAGLLRRAVTVRPAALVT